MVIINYGQKYWTGVDWGRKSEAKVYERWGDLPHTLLVRSSRPGSKSLERVTLDTRTGSYRNSKGIVQAWVNGKEVQ